MRSATHLLSTSLDHLVRPEIHAIHRSWPAFRACGYVGLIGGVALAEMLTIKLGCSPSFMGWIVVAAVFTFLVVAMATKIVTGEEQLTYYRYEVAVIIATRLLLWFLHEPALRYLDFTILGTGLFLAWGRVGCLMVGCCHGRPHVWGVAYRQEHSAAGFPSYLVGVRLYPIQAVESLWVFGIVSVGAVLALSGHAPGTALAWYVVTYSVGRFGFEFMRGDSGRAYFWGFSEAQWTSLLLVFGVSGAELAGLLPFHRWHAAAVVALAGTWAAVVLRRRLQRTPKHQLLHPRHIKELAIVIKALSDVAAEPTGSFKGTSTSGPIHIACTSLGVQVSGGQLSSAEGGVYHCALSSRAGDMTRDAAQILAGLILQLQRASGRTKMIGGRRGVFHLLYTTAADAV